ncbi:D-tyrosyl-tRNA(Tyr) deacylase [Puccinia graminis f. sp. tritici]|nr:D-tyrosyl-tRNA(Tyr) deacylase [Puccinia graminis f. sp. tritici]
MSYIVSKILSLRLFPSSASSSSSASSLSLPSNPTPIQSAIHPTTTYKNTEDNQPDHHLTRGNNNLDQQEEEKPSSAHKEWTKSVRDIDGEVLIVSQFTLMAKTKKGNKPDFHNAMKTDLSKALYEELLKSLKSTYSEALIKEGQFGAMMNVNISNDGPVTIILDTNDK